MPSEKRLKQFNLCFVVINESDTKTNEALKDECLAFMKTLIKKARKVKRNIIEIEFIDSCSDEGFVIISRVAHYERIYDFSQTNIGKGIKNIVSAKNEKCRVVLHNKNNLRQDDYDYTKSKFKSKEF